MHSHEQHIWNDEEELHTGSHLVMYKLQLSKLNYISIKVLADVICEPTLKRAFKMFVFNRTGTWESVDSLKWAQGPSPREAMACALIITTQRSDMITSHGRTFTVATRRALRQNTPRTLKWVTWRRGRGKRAPN